MTNQPASGNGPAIPEAYRRAFEATSGAEIRVEGLTFGIVQLVTDHLSGADNPVNTALHTLCSVLEVEVRALIAGRQNEWNTIREGRA